MLAGSRAPFVSFVHAFSLACGSLYLLTLKNSARSRIGVPFLANDGGAKAYIHSLGEALHYEFKPRGVYVTVVQPPLTNTPVLAKLGFDPRTMPMKPMSVEQCVSEGLSALRENRSRILPGRMNRIMNALVPASVKRTFTAKMLGKSLGNRTAAVSARVEA